MEASQASIVFRYLNIKTKLLTTNLHVKLNKKCLVNKVVPKYDNIRIQNTSNTAVKMKERAEIMWIKEEIKYLYAKKANLIIRLYKTHLELLGSIHPPIINKDVYKRQH